jgi:hypothetical protein
LGLTVPFVSACGDDSSPPASGPAPAFAGRYLWAVGNCEQGTLTPVDPATGEATLCAGDAVEVDKCVDTKLYKMVIKGMEVTITTPYAEWMERLRFDRTVNCEDEPSIQPSSCKLIERHLAEHESLYLARRVDWVPGDKLLYADSLWMVMDKPWPGLFACGDESDPRKR